MRAGFPIGAAFAKDIVPSSGEFRVIGLLLSSSFA